MYEDQRGPIRKAMTNAVEKLDRCFGKKELKVRREEITFINMPITFDRYRVLQISDLHSRCFGENQRDLLQAIRREVPEMIFLTGDLIDKEYNEEEKRCIWPLLEEIVRIAPCYAIEGNHEARTDTAAQLFEDMRSLGITVLLDEGVEVKQANGNKIGIVGLRSDPDSSLKRKKSVSPEKQKIRNDIMKMFDPGEFVILLAHCPEELDSYLKMGVTLIFSGHAHGGLMKLPFGLRLLAPGQGIFPRYTHDLIFEQESVMLVSAGLGGARLGIQPELVSLVMFEDE